MITVIFRNCVGSFVRISRGKLKLNKAQLFFLVCWSVLTVGIECELRIGKIFAKFARRLGGSISLF